MKYSQLNLEVQEISGKIMESDRDVPSGFWFLKPLRFHLALYFTFILLCVIAIPKEDLNGIWFFFLAFGCFHWLVILGFSSSYSNLFSMLKTDRYESYEISRILSRKIKVYGCVWAFVLLALGIVGLTTELNIAAIVIGNFIFVFLLFIVFSIDVSRYQISSIIAVMNSVKKHLSK